MIDFMSNCIYVGIGLSGLAAISFMISKSFPINTGKITIMQFKITMKNIKFKKGC